jgi:hypothetical protein
MGGRQSSVGDMEFGVGNVMTYLSQEIVEFLNQAGPGSLADWLEQNPVIRNFVTCPYLSIRPTALPDAQRITAHEGHHGRCVEIQNRDGSHRYIIDVARWDITVENVEALIHDIDQVGGECRVERSYLVLFVPTGYVVDVIGQGPVRMLQLCQLEYTDIGLV